MYSNVCPVCELEEAHVEPRPDGADAETVKCPRCGEFELSRTLCTELELKTDEKVAEKYAPRWVLSAAIRNKWEQGQKLELLTNTVEELLDVAAIPEDPFESINLLLSHIRSKAETPGKPVELHQTYDYPLVYARSPEEFQYYINKARELGLIEPGDEASGYRLGLSGWQHLKEERQNRSEGDQAFVAMWFSDDMTSAYTDGIQPALEECNYRPLRIDMQEHNEKIDDRIIAEIRQSSLIVADFTGQRGGVYFEAGFAKGLGIPVIWTCHEDGVENLHFDTRQYNHIVWESPEDLKTKLINRISATLL